MTEEEMEIDVSSCVFTVKDPDGTILLTTASYKQAFDLKGLRPGSAVFVEATVDVAVDNMQKLAEGGVFGDPNEA